MVNLMIDVVVTTVMLSKAVLQIIAQQICIMFSKPLPILLSSTLMIVCVMINTMKIPSPYKSQRLIFEKLNCHSAERN